MKPIEVRLLKMGFCLVMSMIAGALGFFISFIINASANAILGFSALLFVVMVLLTAITVDPTKP